MAERHTTRGEREEVYEVGRQTFSSERRRRNTKIAEKTFFSFQELFLFWSTNVKRKLNVQYFFLRCLYLI